MIALDPEFLGALAPPSKLTGGVNPDTVPFARRSRIERLRIQGKADETEAVSEGEEASSERPEDFDSEAANRDRAERQKRKMRGKGKSLKRCVGPSLSSVTMRSYLRLLH
jgi:U3 small nucleolar RNA-associated protein 7